jgi:hypothetical protein
MPSEILKKILSTKNYMKMKKQLLIAFLLLSAFLKMNAQSLYVPNRIDGIGLSNNINNVGIGTPDPKGKLHIIGLNPSYPEA